MYLKGSKWNVTHKKKRGNPLNVFILVILIGVGIYINQVVVPTVQPIGIPTETPTRAPESYITDAEAVLKEGKLEPAIKAYQVAIQANPKNISLHLTLADLYIQNGDYTDAAKAAENALLLNPNHSMASAIRGYALGLSGDYLPALAALLKAIEQDPHNGTAFAYYAEVLAMQSSAGQGDLGTMDKAVEASRTAISLAPNTLETHSARGLVLELTGNYEEAIQEFEAAVKINGNIASLRLALGRNYKYTKQLEKAIEEFNRANTLNPADPNPNFYISKTYGQVGEYAKAIQYAQQAIKAKPDDPEFLATLYANLGSLYYRNHDYENAITALRLAIQGGNDSDGNEVEGLNLDYGTIATYFEFYGLALARCGECAEGLQISQIIQQGVPNDEDAIFNAQEIVNICKNLSENMTATPAEAEVIEPGNTATAEPFPTLKPTRTLIPSITPTRTRIPTDTPAPNN